MLASSGLALRAPRDSLFGDWDKTAACLENNECWFGNQTISQITNVVEELTN